MSDNNDRLLTLITGANQGIGYYAAQQLAATGQHTVLLGSRDLAKGQKAVEELVKEGASREALDAVQIDVTDDESIEAAVKSIEGKYGRLDVVSS